MKKGLWHRLFLEERPSLALTLFRPAAALTAAGYVLPRLFSLKEIFPTGIVSAHHVWIADLVQKSPHGLVIVMAGLFCVAWFLFFIGLWTQASCLVMTLAYGYFYAFYAAVSGGLAWNFFWEVLVMMCLTGYAGDYFSLDVLRRPAPDAYAKRRPFFVQRLLQIQAALFFFFVGLSQVTGAASWPALSGATGGVAGALEIAMPFLLFYRRTRLAAVGLGVILSVALTAAGGLPVAVFFLVAVQLGLFPDPENLLRRIGVRRAHYQKEKQAVVVYDGHCRFCRASVERLQAMDLFARLDYRDYQTVEDVKMLHPDLTREKAHSQMHLIEPDGTLYGGFGAFRRMGRVLPMMCPLVPLMYFPGVSCAGSAAYRWVANNRYLFHRSRACEDNACFR